MKRLLFLLTVTIFLVSCENDVNSNAEHKEVIVIYGLLDQKDSEQQVRVQKGFLGDGNLLTFAQESDSLYADVEKVDLVEVRSGKDLKVMSLTKKYVSKIDGDFATGNHHIYVTSEALNPNSDYRIEVKSAAQDELTHATTRLITDGQIVAPTVVKVNFTNQTNVQWLSSVNGRVYQLYIVFHYLENGVAKSIEFPFPVKTSGSLKGGEVLSMGIEPETFFRLVGEKIEPSETIKREAVEVEFRVSVGTEELSRYMDLTTSSGLTGTATDYTNVENGTGLFSARTSFKTTKGLSSLTLDSLACGRFTYGRGFPWLRENPADNTIDTTYCY